MVRDPTPKVGDLLINKEGTKAFLEKEAWLPYSCWEVARLRVLLCGQVFGCCGRQDEVGYDVYDVKVKETRRVPRRGWRVHREGPAERSYVPSVRALSRNGGGPKAAAATSCTVRPFRGGVNLGAPFKEPSKVDEGRLERALVAAQREVEVELEEAKILQALRALG